MDASEPRPRRRGYFLTVAEPFDLDPGEDEAAEGVRIRVRIIRPRPRRRVAASRQPAFGATQHIRQPLPGAEPGSSPAALRRHAPAGTVK